MNAQSISDRRGRIGSDRRHDPTWASVLPISPPAGSGCVEVSARVPSPQKRTAPDGNPGRPLVSERTAKNVLTETRQHGVPHEVSNQAS
jgi:hypothetical protein